MNLLESVLYASDAAEYIDLFNNHCVDAFTLKILNREDLKVMGVEDEIKIEAILKHAKNLQIKGEQLEEIIISKKYMKLVLSQMNLQITKHLASISIALNRKDLVVCDIKLGAAAKCMRSCVQSLENQLKQFELQVCNKKPKKKYPRKIILLPITLATIVIIMYKLRK